MKMLLIAVMVLACSLAYVGEQDYTEVSGGQVIVSTDMGSGVSVQTSGTEVTVRFDN